MRRDGSGLGSVGLFWSWILALVVGYVYGKRSVFAQGCCGMGVGFIWRFRNDGLVYAPSAFRLLDFGVFLRAKGIRSSLYFLYSLSELRYSKVFDYKLQIIDIDTSESLHSSHTGTGTTTALPVLVKYHIVSAAARFCLIFGF